MRKLFLLIAPLIFSLSSHAQDTTYVYGKLTSFWADTVTLRTYEYFPVHTDYFDDKGENGIRISTNVKEDSTFCFSTDLITAKYTTVLLGIKGSYGPTLLVSSGDSMGIKVCGPIEEPEFEFSGRGAGRNTLYNGDDKRLDNSGDLTGFPADIDEDVLKNKISMYQTIRKDHYDGFLNDGVIDSVFNETLRRMNHYAILDALYQNIQVNQSLSDDFVTSVYDSIARIDLNDLDAMSGIHYPNLIRIYPKVRAQIDKKVLSDDFIARIRLGQELYTGPIKTFYLKDLIFDYIDQAETKKQKLLICDYAMRHTEDPRLHHMIEQEKESLQKSVDQNNSWLFGMWAVFAVGFIIIWFVFRHLMRVYRNVKPSDPKPNPMLIAIFLIMVGLISPVFEMMYKNPIRLIWPQVSGILTILYFIAYGRWILDFLEKRKYWKYILFTVICVSIYILGLYLTLHFYSDWKTTEVNGQVRRWGAIVPVASGLMALLWRYGLKLFEDGKDWRYLFQKMVDNLEFVIHLVFVSSIFFYLASRLGDQKGIRDMIWFLTAAGLFYAEAFWTAPQFRHRNRKTLHGVINGGFLLFGLLLFLLNDAWYNYVTLKSQGIMIPFGTLILPPGIINFIVILASSLGTFYATIRRNYFRQINLNLNLFRKKEAELQQLRSQVNPHFLFNSLNMVYAQALKENSEQTAESIAKLSNLMRYLIEDMDQETIPISKEIGYIRDYIRLQRSRSSVDPEIQFEVELTEEQEQMPIAPMLMIPFVENAFKHGVNPNKKSRLDIRIAMEKDRFIFEIRNPCDPALERFEKEKGFGIGIPNVRKRLEYNYPNRHKLSIEDTETYYMVKLSVNLDA